MFNIKEEVGVLVYLLFVILFSIYFSFKPVLVLLPVIGIVLLYLLSGIYGSKASFRSYIPIWFLAHIIWIIPLLFPQTRISSVYLLLVFITGKLLKGSLKKGNYLDSTSAMSVTVLYGVFIYIFHYGNLILLDVFYEATRLQTGIFYAIILLIIYYNRNKLTKESFLLLYRTKIGIVAMDKIANKFPKSLKVLGILGIIIGYLSMLFITVYIFYNVFQLLFIPKSIPAITPLIPGVKIPGSEITLPLFYGIISLFFVVVIHEFSHGVMARVYKIPVKSSGLVLMGPLFGAFVEPDENHLAKQKAKVQLSVYAAGPFSNMLTALFVIFIISPFILEPASNTFFEISNVTIAEIRENSPAQKAGVMPMTNILAADDVKIARVLDFTKFMINATVGKEIVLETNKGQFNIIPEKSATENKAVIGVTLQDQIAIKQQYSWLGSIPWFLSYVATFFMWFIIISIGIGFANLLPLGPVDGGRMLQTGLIALTKKNGYKLWKSISLFLALALLFILFFPLLKWALPHIFP